MIHRRVVLISSLLLAQAKIDMPMASLAAKSSSDVSQHRKCEVLWGRRFLGGRHGFEGEMVVSLSFCLLADIHMPWAGRSLDPKLDSKV